MDYKTINAALTLAGIESISTSELHGYITGGLCTQGANFDLKHGPFEEPLEANQALKNCFRDMIRSTVAQLDQYDTVPDLLLPDDSELLSIRCRNLAEWCQGFLFALGASGIPDKSLNQGEAGEILKDMIEISHAYHEDTTDSDQTEILEDNESAYIEIVEYLRAGVMLINETLRPALAQDSTTVH